MTLDEFQHAVIAVLDQFIERGVARDVRDLRGLLASDDGETRTRLVDQVRKLDPNEREAFDAMRRFVALEQERSGRDTAEENYANLVMLLSWTGWDDWADGETTIDPAQWHDWLAAVRQVTAP